MTFKNKIKLWRFNKLIKLINNSVYTTQVEPLTIDRTAFFISNRLGEKIAKIQMQNQKWLVLSNVRELSYIDTFSPQRAFRYIKKIDKKHQDGKMWYY